MRPFTIASEPTPTARAIGDAWERRLPVRYRTDLWDHRFRARLRHLLSPGVAVLDVGAGRCPTVSPAERPPRTHYVGLDVEASELAMAAPGSYDDTVVCPAEERVVALEGRFDVIVSFFALEHMRSTAAVLGNMHAYLRPGGWFVAQLAGSRSPFSFVNRLIPPRLSQNVLSRTQGRQTDSIFPARYDRCSYSELVELLDHGWAEREVLPLFTGAGYVLFSRVLTTAYIAYEEWVYRTGRRDLSPYYLVVARK